MSNLQNISVRTDASGSQWREIYEEAFPASERVEIADYMPLFADGSARLYESFDDKGDTVTMSIVEVVSDDTLLLSYLATDVHRRSSAFGTRHMRRLVEQLKEEFPSAGLYIEIDSRNEAGISEAELIIRQRRASFYHNLGAQWWAGTYTSPDLSDDGGEPLSFEFICITMDGDAVGFERFRDAARLILVDSYELPEDHELVVAIESQHEDADVQRISMAPVQFEETDLVSEDVKPD